MSNGIENHDNLLGIVGLIESSMLEWPGKVVTTLFTAGCNFRCPFCHNADLVLKPETFDEIPWSQVERHLENKIGWIDAISVTGGEPTLNPNLAQLSSMVKEAGYLFKLDTNGTRPEVVAQLISQNLIDYVAMDVKAAFERYSEVAGVDGYVEEVKRSMDILIEAERDGALEAEFRTTFVPSFVDEDDILWIAEYLAERGASRYTLQRFRSTKILSPSASDIPTVVRERLKPLAEKSSHHLPTSVR